MSKPRPEKRRYRRTKGRQAAWIKCDPHAAPIPCVLWDQSDKGARVSAAHSLRLPDTFALIARDKTARMCRVAWRNSAQLGIMFVDANSVTRLGVPGQTANNQPGAKPPGDGAPPLALLRVAPRLHGPNEVTFAVSHLAAGFLLLLIGLTAAFYLAGSEQPSGAVWAQQLCGEANSLCRHPELPGGASVLMAVLFFLARAVEL